MSDDKDSDKKKTGKSKSGKKNPWGNVKGSGSSSKERGTKQSAPHQYGNLHSINGGGRGNGGNNNQPDVEQMIRQAKDNFDNIIPGGMGGGIFGIGIGLLLLIAFVSLCTFIVQPGEQAVVQRFGAYERTKTTEGLGFKWPNPVEQVTKVNVATLRNMSIGYTQSFRRGAGQDIPEESLMLTSDRNIVDIDLDIQWIIKSAEEYLFNIQDQENTIKKVAESAIREVVGQTRMFPIITTDRNEVAERAKAIIQNNLDDYNSGVNINQVLIKSAEVHPDVQQAFQDVQSAKQDAEDTQNRAQAYREDILPKARGQAIELTQTAQGYKDSQIARSTGDADRFNSIYTAYLEGKDVTKERLYIETMEEVLTNAQKIILDQQGGSGVVPYLPLNGLTNKAQSTPRNAN